MPLRTILITATRSGTASTVIIRRGASGTGTGGTGDHGDLTGLGDDDHTQYHNDARGDARYATTSALAGKANLTGNPNFTGGITVDNGNSNIAGIIADGLVFGDRLSIDNDSQFIGPVTMFTPLPITSGGTGVGSIETLGTFRTALKVPGSIAGVGGSIAISNIVSITLANYNLIGTKDPTTLYVING